MDVSLERDEDSGSRFMIGKKIFVNKNHLGKRLSRKESKESEKTFLPQVEKIRRSDTITNDVKLRSQILNKINKLIEQKHADPDNPEFKRAEELGLPWQPTVKKRSVLDEPEVERKSISNLDVKAQKLHQLWNANYKSVDAGYADIHLDRSASDPSGAQIYEGRNRFRSDKPIVM